MKKLVVFDFDKTITTKDSFNDFLIYSFGIKKFIFTIAKNINYIAMYKFGKIDNSVIKSRLFKAYFKNKNYDYYYEKCIKYSEERLHEIINKDILDKIKYYKENNYEVIILSASFKEWIEPFKEKYSIDKLITSTFKVEKNIIVGDISKTNSCYGKNKLVKLKKEININSYDRFIAYGDSKSDHYYMDESDEKYLVKNNKPYLVDEYAIVTDGLWRKSVSVIRSIGKMGIKPIVLGDTYLSTGMWSRYAFKKKKINNYDNSFDSIVNDCKDKPVIFPMEENTILWLSNNRDKLKDKSYFLIPSKKSLEISLDKSLTIKEAMKANVSCPITYFPKTAEELKKIILDFKSNDYIIKPCHGSGSRGLLYGDNVNLEDLDEHWKEYGKLIFQERVPKDGDGVGVSVIMDEEHNVKGVFGHIRVEQYPNSGGPSTQRKGYYNKQLIDESIKLLKHLKWTGVAMVEWKFNTRTNKFVLMEINPRFWGSLELAVRSGVDFPFIYYQLSKKRDIADSLDFRTDVLCRWLLPGDVLRYITKKNREPLSKFLKGMIKDSEEWDKNDKRTFLASILCQGLLILNPKYWKYVRR